MASSVRTFLPVVGDPAALAAAFESDPQAWLPEPRREGQESRWSVSVRAGALSRTVRTGVGAMWRSGTTRWRSLSWKPAGDTPEPGAVDRFLPSFDGELGLDIVDDEHITLVLDGWYQPPGGVLGTAVDAVALRRVARATMDRFLADVAARLSAKAVLDGGSRPPPPRRGVAEGA